MAELSTSQPLFPGDSDIDQLYIVQKMLGENQTPGQYGYALLLVPATCCQHSAATSSLLPRSWQALSV